MIERVKWETAWDLLGLTPPRGLLAELTARYAEPHRAYHTMQHIRECFTVLEPAASRRGHARPVVPRRDL
jgi:predicted metal-dependent HD superfamily phosphohydrolase